MRTSIATFFFRYVLLVLCFCPHQILEASDPYKVPSPPKQVQKNQIDLTVIGSVNNNDGLGRQATDLMLTLADTMSMSYLQSGPLYWNEVDEFPAAIQKIIHTPGKDFPGKVLIQMDMLADPCDHILRHSYWSTFGLPEKTNDQIRFAYTMFESSRAPQFWVYLLNKFFDAAIVPDRFLIEVYKNSGVTIPIFYIPLGRDFSRFLNAPLKISRNSPFIFANFSTCIPRKNLVTLVRAFAEAFGNSPKVQLRLGWRGADANTQQNLYSAIAACKLTNIKIDDYALSADDYVQRFLGVDCYVSPSTGEGFSNQPREAMALGIPVIVTKNTGQRTICSSGLVRVIPSTIEIPALYSFPGRFGVQYQCEHKDVVEALLDMYNNYDTYLHRATKARKWAKQYHYTNMASLYHALVKPTKVLHGTSDKILDDGGIMTTSEALIQKYMHLKLGRPSTQSRKLSPFSQKEWEMF